MLISCFFWGAADCFGEVGLVGDVRRIFCLDNAHAGHTKNPREMMVSLRELCFRRVPM